jgi:hypothetical protein
LAIILGVAGISWWALQSSRVQTYLTRQLTTHLSEQLNANVSVGRVSIGFFNRILLEDILLEDRQADTLIFIQSLSANIESLNIRQKKLALSKLTFENSRINAVRDSLNRYNFHFLPEFFKNSTREDGKWQYRCKEFNFSEATLAFQYGDQEKPERIEMNNLNTRISDFYFLDDSLYLKINQLTFHDGEEFKINEFNSEFFVSGGSLQLNGLNLKTDYSSITGSRVRIELPGDTGNIPETVQFDLQISASQISFYDLAQLVPALEGMDQLIDFSGHIQGNMNNLRGRNLMLKTGKQTYAMLDFYANDISTPEMMYLFIDLKESGTTLEELSRIKLPEKGEKRFFQIPETLFEAGRITYRGNFTGFLTDFVAYGTLNSEMGKVTTDLSVVPGEGKNITYRGQIETQDFNLGELIKNEYVDNISFNGEVDGSYDLTSHMLAGNFSGDVSSVEINSYQYRNIRLDGLLNNRLFDGLVVMNDPNLQFDFLGKLNFNPKIPVFDFRLDLKKALPGKLNLIDKFPEAELSFLMNANFSGNQIDNLAGSIQVEKGYYKNRNGLLELNGTKLQSLSGGINNYLSFSSGYFDIEINGLYHFQDIFHTFEKSMNRYIPAFGYDPLIMGKENKFGYQINGKNLDAVTAVFAPKIRIETPFLLYGQMDSEKSVFELKGSIPMIQTDKLMLRNIYIGNNPKDGIYLSQFRFGEILLKNGRHLENLTVTSEISENTLNNQIAWGQEESEMDKKHISKYRGLVRSKVLFSKVENSSRPLINIDGLSSQIFIADSIWQIEPFTATIDTSSILINHFYAHSSSQTIGIDGEIAKSDSSLLSVFLRNINLAYLGDYLETELPLEGMLHGTFQLQDIFGKRLLFSKLGIDRFKFRNREIGDVSMSNQWDRRESVLKSEVTITRNQKQHLYASGHFNPETRELQYQAELDQMPLVVLETVIRNNFSDFRGDGFGKVRIHGTPDKILLTGALEGRQAGLTIDYTRVGYQFSDSVYFRGDTILFDHIALSDTDGNRGTFNGTIVHDNFQDMKYNLEVASTRITAMNTNAKDNSVFYGKVVANGSVFITGRAKTVFLAGSGTTLSGTNVNISLEDESVLERYDFIQFVSTEDTDRQEFLFSGKDNGDFSLDLTITATPEARAQLIYNSQIGDVIRAQGEGVLRFGMNKEGDITLSGSYAVERGDYLFTLQNVINKRFTIEQGGTIEWSGDPYNALIDINAVYRLKASLYDLLVNTYDNIYQSQRIPVECKIMLSEELSNPTIDFAIQFPTVEDRLVEELKQFFNTTEEMNKQILSLVVLGKFYTPEYLRGTYEAQNPNLIGTTASELFSNQLSNWLSQISTNVDIGLNYRPGNQITNDEIELALSTQMFNDRVTINGNIGNNSNPNSTNNSQLVGDFDVNVKLIPSGKIRLKAYNRSNNNLIYETAPYTQGVGFTFTENFNTFNDLLKKMNAIFTRKEEE